MGKIMSDNDEPCGGCGWAGAVMEQPPSTTRQYTDTLTD